MTNQEITRRLGRLRATDAEFLTLVRALRVDVRALPSLLGLLRDDDEARTAMAALVQRIEAHPPRAYLAALARGLGALLPAAPGWTRALHRRILENEKTLFEYQKIISKLPPIQRRAVRAFLDELAAAHPQYLGRVGWVTADSPAKERPAIAAWRFGDQHTADVELTPVQLGQTYPNLAPPRDSGELAALFGTFDDRAVDAGDDALWATVRRVEAAAAPAYLKALFDAVAEMATRAPSWAALLHGRALGDPAQRRRYRELFRQLAASRRRIVRVVLERVAADIPALGDEVRTLLGGMR